jgi:integrase/recombinase XerD
MDLRTKEFKNYLIEKEKSQKTIEAYLKDIHQFYDYCKNNRITDIHNETIKQYKEYLLFKKFLTPTSVNRKLIAIHKYFMFCEIPANTTKVKVQTQNFLENVLSKEEIDSMVKIAKEKKDYRAVAIMKTFELTGMRVMEITQIQIKDIHSNTIQIVGKGNKIRNVFIPKVLNNIWMDYCKLSRINKGWDYLFVGKRGRLTRSGIDRIIKKYGKLANVKFEKNHCHSYRHQYAKRLADADVKIDVIADLCGHASIETSRLYTRKSKEELLNIIEDLD